MTYKNNERQTQQDGHSVCRRPVRNEKKEARSRIWGSQAGVEEEEADRPTDFEDFPHTKKMAATTLCEKTEYRLSAFPCSSSSSSSSSSRNQSLFLVKLTDSSERALEKFLANQKRISRRPMIHFESGAGGSISIPSDRRQRKDDPANDDDDDDVFYFSIGQVRK